jgi:hypothetical protein
MDFEQVRHKASAVSLNGGWCRKGHFVDVTEAVPHHGLPGQEDGM